MLLVETVTDFPLDQELVALTGERILATANLVSFPTLHVFTHDPSAFFTTEGHVIDRLCHSELGLLIFLLVRDVVIESTHSRQVGAMSYIRDQNQRNLQS